MSEKTRTENIPAEINADQNEADTRILTGYQKSAILLIALGSDACVKVFKALEEEEVERLASEIAAMQYVSAADVSGVLSELQSMVSDGSGMHQGGVAYATEAMVKALGAEDSVVDRIRAGKRPLGLLAEASGSNETFSSMIREEQPQTIALILVHLKEQRAADVLASLEPDLRSEVISRIANMTEVSPDVIAQVEDALQARSQGHGSIKAGGIKVAAEILNRAEADVEKQVMDSLAGTDPVLAEGISDLMFTYENIVMVSDTGIQRLLPEVDESDLLMALKASTDEIKAKFFRNMSERRRQIIQDDIQALPPVRLKDVLAAQKRILAVIKEMNQSGKIEIVRHAEEEVYV